MNDFWKIDLLTSASQQLGAEGNDPYNLRSLRPLSQALTLSHCAVEEA